MQKSDYIVRWADREDFRTLSSMFLPQVMDADGNWHDRSDSVFRRTDAAMAAAVDDERVVLLTDSTGKKVLAIGALHLHSYIGDIAIPSFKVVAAEIGSIYRPGDYPSSFCRELIYCVLVMQTLRKARARSISMLTTQVVASNEANNHKLADLNQGWESCDLPLGYRAAFESTLVEEAAKNTRLSTYCAPPQKVVMAAAHSLLGLATQHTFDAIRAPEGILSALDAKAGQKASIDMTRTGVIEIADSVSYNSSINGLAHDDASWSEVNGVFLPQARLSATAASPNRRPLSNRFAAATL